MGISMQAMPIRIFLILFILVLIYPSSLIAATERRTALVISNGSYIAGLLRNPAMLVAVLRRAFGDVRSIPASS